MKPLTALLVTLTLLASSAHGLANKVRFGAPPPLGRTACSLRQPGFFEHPAPFRAPIRLFAADPYCPCPAYPTLAPYAYDPVSP